MDIVEKILDGDRRALSKLITITENNLLESYPYLERLFLHSGKAKIIGITGSPGSGKSSLVNQFARTIRKSFPEQKIPIAIIAVDPSSPFSGGALLGDRIRMQDLSADPDIFIRSMAARGRLGGLSAATASVAQILDAAGFEWILIETVGTGQSEVEIASLADTTVLVVTSSMGDDIQLNKAGILEVADVMVVNKCDQPGSGSMAQALKQVLQMTGVRASGHHQIDSIEKQPGNESLDSMEDEWVPPVLLTNALTGDGFGKLTDAVLNHHQYLRESGAWKKKDKNRVKNQLDEIIKIGLLTNWYAKITWEQYTDLMEQVLQRKISPFKAASVLLDMDLSQVDFHSLPGDIFSGL